MPLFPLQVEEFGGLDLTSAPEEVGFGGAVDLLNVDFDQRGRVRSRDGYSTFLSAFSASVKSLAAFTLNGTPWVFIGDRGFNVYAQNQLGTIIGDGIWTAVHQSFAHYGQPGAEYVYAVNGVAGEGERFDGATWSNFGAIPGGSFVATQSTDNRLAVASLPGFTSRVQFSNAGDPGTWPANNFVDLQPGDGGPILALLSWREQLFAFKSDRFFVFYGNSTDTTGNPIFNYRTVNTGKGPINRHQVAAGSDGLYFVNQDGVYRTTGGEPVKISQPLDAWFRRDALPFFGGSKGASASPTMADFYRLSWAQNRLWLTVHNSALTSGIARVTFVYRPDLGTWTYWDTSMYDVVEVPSSANALPLVVWSQYASTVTTLSKQLWVMDPSVSTDNTGAIVSRYRTGYANLYSRRPWRSGSTEKTVREILLDGSGAVDVSVAVNWGAPQDAATITLGTAPAIAQGRYRLAHRGHQLGFQLAASSGAWSVNRLVAMLRGSRAEGLQSAP